MADRSSEISEEKMYSARINHAQEMREIVGSAINARRDLGKSEAAYQVAREMGMKPRRVLAILHGEVVRFWADEMDAARNFYQRECDFQAKRLEHQAEIYRIRSANIRKELQKCG